MYMTHIWWDYSYLYFVLITKHEIVSISLPCIFIAKIALISSVLRLDLLQLS